MKKVNLYFAVLGVLLFFSFDAQAQTWETNSASEMYLDPISSSVGIGTTDPFNSYKLHVTGATTRSGIYGHTDIDNDAAHGVRGFAPRGRGVFGQTSSGIGVYGISSSSGHAGYFDGKVQLTGNLRGKDSNKNFIIKCATSANEKGPYIHMYGTDYNSTTRKGNMVFVYGGAPDIGQIRFTHDSGTNWSTNVSIHADGKMSIGTGNAPTMIGDVDISPYRLFVRGGILTEELRIRTDWADYVFADDYELTSLPEVEEYIKVNGHLHNTPSAAQVEEEGIELGDITVNQQEKIEEIFLHLIELKKEIELLKLENEQLKKTTVQEKK